MTSGLAVDGSPGVVHWSNWNVLILDFGIFLFSACKHKIYNWMCDTWRQNTYMHLPSNKPTQCFRICPNNSNNIQQPEQRLRWPRVTANAIDSRNQINKQHKKTQFYPFPLRTTSSILNHLACITCKLWFALYVCQIVVVVVFFVWKRMVFVFILFVSCLSFFSLLILFPTEVTSSQQYEKLWIVGIIREKQSKTNVLENKKR